MDVALVQWVLVSQYLGANDAGGQLVSSSTMNGEFKHFLF